MDYFWIIPLGIAVVVALWGFYASIKRNAGEREEGTILTDQPSDERRV
jgi:hypothetical protein